MISGRRLRPPGIICSDSVRELYASGYMKTVQDWCTAHGGYRSWATRTRKTSRIRLACLGDLMKCYKYQDVPGS